VRVIEASSREEYRRVMNDLDARGAECVLFGCTEIGLLVAEADAPVPVFDTTVLHAEIAVDLALR
jgi:aspartate racemase